MHTQKYTRTVLCLISHYTATNLFRSGLIQLKLLSGELRKWVRASTYIECVGDREADDSRGQVVSTEHGKEGREEDDAVADKLEPDGQPPGHNRQTHAAGVTGDNTHTLKHDHADTESRS